MRRLITKSIEELLDIQEELHFSRDDAQDGSMQELISVDEELYRRIASDRDSEYAPSLEMIKRGLISNLIHYGTYLKTEYRKDDHTAEQTLRKALRYDKENPVANYRLGFLAYKRRNYIKSIVYFQNALQFHARREESNYNLTPQQMYNANLYLSSSALYIAKDAQKASDQVEGDIKKTTISNLELSPLYDTITQNEKYLRNHAFTITSQNGEKTCSREECDRLIESNLDTFILFSDREHMVFYQESEAQLSIRQAEMLMLLMEHSSEERPATRHKFTDIITVNKKSGEVKANTLSQNIGRLKDKLDQGHLPVDIIRTRRYRDETGYYYDQTVPFMVIQRTDDIR